MSIEQLPLVPGAGPRVVRSSDDVFRHLPAELLLPEADPIRDLLVDALASLLQSYEARSDYAVAQCDVTRAIRQYLSALAEDRSAGRANGEADEPLRARTLESGCVTESMVAAGVDTILSLYTLTKCELVDAGLDGWFIHDGTDGNGGPPQWHSFIGSSPSYPDRLYSDDPAIPAEYRRAHSSVGGARVFSDSLGRLLLVRVPDLGFQLRDAALVFGGPEAPEIGFFVGDGSGEPGGGFLDASSAEPTTIYRAIGSFLIAALGQSIRWEMTSDIVAA